MPYEVTVLRCGKCLEIDDLGNYEIDCSITLLRGRYNLIVDPGSAWDKKFLLSALATHDLKPEDIHYLIGTHGHSDHIGNLNLFLNATHIVCYDVNQGKIYASHDFDEGVPYAIDEDLTIEALPGHTSQDITVFVKSLDPSEGIVAICGDIFECYEDIETPSLWQENSQFPELQEKSRIEILRRADSIVPGHGAMFKVPQSIRDGNSRCEIVSDEDE